VPAARPKLTVIPDQSRASQYRNLRTVKLLQPACEECQKVPVSKWWEHCPHEPYVESQEVEVQTRVVETREDGRKVVTGTTVEIVLTETPRTTQVPLTLRVNSGRGVEQAFARGCITPESMGYAPMCQYYNCWKPVNAKFRTTFGDYCGDEHARLIAADEDQITLEVFDTNKRKRQLRGIDISAA